MFECYCSECCKSLTGAAVPRLYAVPHFQYVLRLYIFTHFKNIHYFSILSIFLHMLPQHTLRLKIFIILDKVQLPLHNFEIIRFSLVVKINLHQSMRYFQWQHFLFVTLSAADCLCWYCTRNTKMSVMTLEEVKMLFRQVIGYVWNMIMTKCHLHFSE